MAHQLPPVPKETTGLRLFPWLTLAGWVLIGFALLYWVLAIAPTAATYWGGQAKATRDAAQPGSILLTQLSFLASWPKLLLPLTFLGVASFMVGISMEFAAIPAILDRRTELIGQALSRLGRGTS